MENIRLALSLIKEDLKINAMLNSLADAGFYVESYSCGICESVFKILEIENTDDSLYEFYWDFMQPLRVRSIQDDLEDLSLKFYAEITALSKKCPAPGH